MPAAANTPWDLPRGANTTVPYLAGRVLHVGGTTYTVPDQSQGGDYYVGYRLVGRDARGRWLVGVAMDLVEEVVEYCYTCGSRARLFAVTGSGAEMLYDWPNDMGKCRTSVSTAADRRSCSPTTPTTTRGSPLPG